MKWENDDLLCSDLLTRPQPEIGTILVSGATGYVGGRLVTELLARGYRVRVMARVSAEECEERWPTAEIVVADALNPNQLRTAVAGIHTAYYLIHSLLLGPKKFESADIRAAVNFREAAEAKNVKRIIYLGALGDTRAPLSPHLRSRIQVAEELRSGKVPTTILRAAIIIGSGSASYEILKSLVKKSPVFLIPFWAKTKCQPISIRSLINILVGVLEVDSTTGKSYDIGGIEILTYETMIKTFAKILNKKKLYFNTSFSNVRFYSYFASFLTPVPAAMIKSLMEGCRNEVVCQNTDIIPISLYRPMMYKEAILKAMSREERDDVHTRWSDEFPRAHELAIKLRELETPPKYISTYSLVSTKEKRALFQAFCKVGGKDGWFNANWMWRLRGALDSILLGVGHTRGRRSLSKLRVNDVVGYWRVEGLVKNYKLLLRAEMKLPGKAWLEFKINKESGKNRLMVTAYFEPRGIFGKIYWYNFLPFHHFIFTNLLKQIDKRA